MRAAAICVAVSALTIGGCTTTGTIDTTGQHGTLPTAENLSPHQREVLDGYIETGEVSYHDYLTAEYEFFGCMEEAGFDVTSAEGRHLGVRQLMYSLRVPDEYVAADGSTPQADEIWSTCEERYNGTVRDLYLTLAQEGAFERLLAEYLPRITACLTDHDVQVPADAESSDIEKLAWNLTEADGTHDGPDCMVESGFALEFLSPLPPLPNVE